MAPPGDAYSGAHRPATTYEGGGLIPQPVDLSTNYREPNSCYSIVRVNSEGTAFVPLFDAKPLCGDPITPERMNQLLGVA
ncbi:hypothetical protein I7412_23725 [Frankia sp. CN6]|uniref:Uncharacterized protein n=1 Tax=Frankia nepalensis TaxID=1836974 RepID=A0A937USB9_9ACTN|nr:hypothetical protein [Frankia nepalensis]MBL7630120.1 hypothetical protein [Frankia nepalensis]